MSNDQIQVLITTIMSYFSIGVLIIGAIAALTSIITEVTKELGFLSSIPTNAQVSVLAIVFTVVAYFTLQALGYLSFTWYYVITSIVIGFITALVAMKGWDIVFDIFKRNKYPEE